MTKDEYKQAITSRGVLDYSTLNITLKEIVAIKDISLANEIKRILSQNKIEKPKLHAKPDDHTTDYFKVDLSSEEIEKIVDLFVNLEAQYIGENGETTPTCAFYASFVDRWYALNDLE